VCGKTDDYGGLKTMAETDTHSEHEEKPASMVDVKRLVRRKLKHIHPHEETSLNIYPMMDMMTILLVFMVQQFATSSANIIQSDELQIPYSTKKSEASESLPVQISQSEIVVDGTHVLALRNGQVDPSQKQGGGTGFLITPLLSVMDKHRKRLKLIGAQNTQRAFKGEIALIADKRTPYRTLTEVIYTVGQAEFKNLHFVILQKSQS